MWHNIRFAVEVFGWVMLAAGGALTVFYVVVAIAAIRASKMRAKAFMDAIQREGETGGR